MTSAERDLRTELLNPDANLRHLLDATTDAIVVHRNRTIVYVNPAALSLFGYASSSEVLGHSPFEFVPTGYRGIVADRIFRTYVNAVTTDEIEERLLQRDGTEIPVESIAIPIVFEGEMATLVHLRDLTARKAMETHLHATDRLAAIGLVATMMAHEVNNPLTFALGNLELLARSSFVREAGDDVRTKLAAVRDGLERAARVTRDIKLFARTGPEAPAIVHVRDVLDSCVRLVGVEAAGRARVVKEYGEVRPLRANAARLGQVFLNLIVNALQAIPVGDEAAHAVALRTFMTDESMVAIEVRDTGVGIRPEMMTVIFDALYTTKTEGTGLGLAICRSMLRDEGGMLEVESEIGRGSCFRVLLPPAPSVIDCSS